MAEFRWYGHNCFRIRAKEATIVTDPVGKNTGYSMPKLTADVVTVSHDHPGHNNLAAVRSDPPYQLVTGPGEYEIHDVFVTGVRTYHDTKQGAERGYNTVYLIEVEGLIICHLGDLGHALNSEQAEALSNADVLLVPAGGDGTSIVSPAHVMDVITQIEPKIVIPMQYAAGSGDKSKGDLATFCKQLGVEQPAPEEKYVLRHSELNEAMKVVSLVPEA